MFATGQLNACRDQKQALLRQSEANREAFRATAAHLRPVVLKVEMGISLARTAKTIIGLISPLFGGQPAPASRWGGLVGKLGKGLTLARSILALWEAWKKSDHA